MKRIAIVGAAVFALLVPASAALAQDFEIGDCNGAGKITQVENENPFTGHTRVFICKV